MGMKTLSNLKGLHSALCDRKKQSKTPIFKERQDPLTSLNFCTCPLAYSPTCSSPTRPPSLKFPLGFGASGDDAPCRLLRVGGVPLTKATAPSGCPGHASLPAPLLAQAGWGWGIYSVLYPCLSCHIHCGHRTDDKRMVSRSWPHGKSQTQRNGCAVRKVTSEHIRSLLLQVWSLDQQQQQL